MRWIGLAIAVLAFAADAAEGRLEKRACWFEYEPSDPRLRVECAVLRVPERWEGPAGGREVTLPVVRLLAGHGKNWATLVPGGGGPGATA